MIIQDCCLLLLFSWLLNRFFDRNTNESKKSLGNPGRKEKIQEDLLFFCHFFNHVVKIISVLIWVDKHKFLTFSTRGGNSTVARSWLCYLMVPCSNPVRDMISDFLTKSYQISTQSFISIRRRFNPALCQVRKNM